MSDYIIHNGTLMSEELYHYGVLGMKWGKRRAQSRGDTYTYKSHTTKKYEKKARRTKDASKAEIYKNRAKRSAQLDRAEQRVAEQTKTGRVIATRMLTQGIGAKSYQRFQAMGATKTQALGLAALDSMFGLDVGHRIAKAMYIRKGE